MICAEDLKKCFIDKGRGVVTALDGVSVTVERGELVVVVGPSGCGKSTLLRCLAGLEAVDTGRIFVDGRDVTTYPPEHRHIEWLPQRISATFFSQKPLHYNMELGGRIKGIARKKLGEKLRWASELVGIENLLGRTPDAVSGGELQRAAIARALMSDSKVMLFDEPMASLDEIRRASLLREFRAINRQIERAVLYVTHEQREALSLGTRCMVMNNGRVEQDAPPHDVYFRPANLFVARFFSPFGLNEIQGRLEWDRGTPFVVVEGARFVFPALSDRSSDLGEEVIVGIRPEVIRVVPAGTSSNLVSLGKAEIVDPQFMGRETLLHVCMTSSGQDLLASSSHIDDYPTKGAACLAIDPNDIFLFCRATGNNLQGRRQ